MSRSVSTFTVAVLIFTLFTILTSAAPIGVDCDKPDVSMSSKPGQGSPVPSTSSPVPEPTTSPVPTPPKTDNSTSSTDTTVVDDSSSDDSSVVNVNTLATTGTYSGTATYFSVGTGACGKTNTDADMIVALPQANWGGGANCGKTISITNSKNGRVHSATVADLCPGCGSGSLDMSPALFKALNDNLSDGTFPESWSYA